MGTSVSILLSGFPFQAVGARLEVAQEDTPPGPNTSSQCCFLGDLRLVSNLYNVSCPKDKNVV